MVLIRLSDKIWWQVLLASGGFTIPDDPVEVEDLLTVVLLGLPKADLHRLGVAGVCCPLPPSDCNEYTSTWYRFMGRTTLLRAVSGDVPGEDLALTLCNCCGLFRVGLPGDLGPWPPERMDEAQQMELYFTNLGIDMEELPSQVYSRGKNQEEEDEE